MIIQCPECSTRFKLGEDKLKPEGIKVRCAKCRHVFVLFPPEPVAEEIDRPSSEPDRQEDPWADSFNEILENSQPGETPPDHGETSWDEALESSFADVGATISGPDPGERDDFESLGPPPEATSEFNAAELNAADLGLEEESETSAAPDLSLPLFTSEPLISGDLRDESTASADGGGPETIAASVAAVDEFQFEEVEEEEEFSFEETADSEIDPFAAHSESEEALIDGTAAPDDSLFPEETEKNEAIAGFSFQEEGVEAFSFAPEKTESAESFAFQEEDLFAPEPPPNVGDSFFAEAAQADSFYPDGAPEGAETGFEFSETENSAVFDRTAEEMPIPVATSRPTGERVPPTHADAPPEPLSEPRPKTHEPKRGPMAAVLRIFVLLLLLLAASAGYLIWRDGVDSLPRILGQIRALTGTAPPTQPAVHIRLPLPNSFFVMNQHAGQLFVIQGEAVNGYPEPRSAISVTGMLHDAKGDVLLRQTVFCGNPMDLETLKSAPFAAIQEIMSNPFGSALANVNIAPGTPIPYMIVFRDLPDNVTHFTVEVADSKIGESH